MKEIWKDIKGYEGMYQVSNLGRVKSFKKGKESILKNRENRGYKSICLSIGDNKFKGFSVHRLVALAFLGENNLPVNHINGNKSDNRIENLEFVTHMENMGHKSLQNANKTSKFIGVYHRSDRNKWVARIQINNKNESFRSI